MRTNSGSQYPSYTDAQKIILSKKSYEVIHALANVMAICGIQESKIKRIFETLGNHLKWTADRPLWDGKLCEKCQSQMSIDDTTRSRSSRFVTKTISMPCLFIGEQNEVNLRKTQSVEIFLTCCSKCKLPQLLKNWCYVKSEKDEIFTERGLRDNGKDVSSQTAWLCCLGKSSKANIQISKSILPTEKIYRKSRIPVLISIKRKMVLSKLKSTEIGAPSQSTVPPPNQQCRLTSLIRSRTFTILSSRTEADGKDKPEEHIIKSTETNGSCEHSQSLNMATHFIPLNRSKTFTVLPIRAEKDHAIETQGKLRYPIRSKIPVLIDIFKYRTSPSSVHCPTDTVGNFACGPSETSPSRRTKVDSVVEAQNYQRGGRQSTEIRHFRSFSRIKAPSFPLVRTRTFTLIPNQVKDKKSWAVRNGKTRTIQPPVVKVETEKSRNDITVRLADRGVGGKTEISLTGIDERRQKFVVQETHWTMDRMKKITKPTLAKHLAAIASQKGCFRSRIPLPVKMLRPTDTPRQRSSNRTNASITRLPGHNAILPVDSKKDSSTTSGHTSKQ